MAEAENTDEVLGKTEYVTPELKFSKSGDLMQKWMVLNPESSAYEEDWREVPTDE